MTDYEQWCFDFIDNNKKLLDKNGVAEMSLCIEVFNNGEVLMNFEIFSKELLKKVGQYDIAIPISCYWLTTEQIIEMLDETEISKEKIEEHIRWG